MSYVVGWYNHSYPIAAKPIKTLELCYPMIQIIFNNWLWTGDVLALPCSLKTFLVWFDHLCRFTTGVKAESTQKGVDATFPALRFSRMWREVTHEGTLSPTWRPTLTITSWSRPSITVARGRRVRKCAPKQKKQVRVRCSEWTNGWTTLLMCRLF